MGQDRTIGPGKLSLIWLFFVLLLITGCRGNETDEELSDRITLWHSWPPL